MLCSRTAVLAVTLGWMLASTGCFLSAGPFEEEGAGGTGASGSGGSPPTTTTTTTTTTTGSGGTGAAGGSGGTGGSTATTTTSMPGCTTAADCDDHNPCTDDSCNGSQKCEHAASNEGATPAGTDDPPGDCLKPVCNGGMLVDEVDKDQTPDTDPNDCANTYCLTEGGMMTDPANNGALCGQQPTNECQKSICDGGGCVVVGLADGTVVDPGDTNIPSGGTDCRDKVCQGGVVVQKSNFLNCADPTTGNCAVPSCNGSGQCLTGAGAMAAPAGFPCDTNGDGTLDGKCDGNGSGSGNCKP